MRGRYGLAARSLRTCSGPWTGPLEKGRPWIRGDAGLGDSEVWRPAHLETTAARSKPRLRWDSGGRYCKD